MYELSHIPQAHFLDIETDLSGEKTGQNGRHPLPDLEQLAKKLAQLGMNHDTQVVFYDDAGGMMAARGWWLLRAMGHSAVAVLDGGIQAWENTGNILTHQLPDAKPVGNFQLKPSLMRVLSVQEVQNHLNSGHQLLIDARSPERFRGEVEPIDPVAGHITGAVNRFCNENLQTNLHFKSEELLRSEWQAIAGTHPVAEWVLYCGSGITASHNLLSLDVAGLDISTHGAGLYAGSWSEWISDPNRPREP